MSVETRDLFDAAAGRWTKKYAPGGTLRSRLNRFAAELTMAQPPPASVLDLGCGTGDLSRHFNRLGYRVVGCDIAPAMIDAARTLDAEHAVIWTLLEAEWRTLPFPDAAFDVAIASSVLEYVDDVEHVLGELGRVVRIGGSVIVTIPDMRHPVRWLEQVVAWGALHPFMRGLVERAQRGRSALRYLRLSRNRWRLWRWDNIAAGAGLARRPRSIVIVRPLAMLRFRRQ